MDGLKTSLDSVLTRLGPDIHERVTGHIAAQFFDTGPARIMEIHIRDGRLVFDPLARSGFVLRLDADTEQGNLDAAFSPDGELLRGLIGDDLVMNTDRLIATWQTACGRDGR